VSTVNYLQRFHLTTDHLGTLILQAGKGSFLVKADIKEAYQMIPIHPRDCHLIPIHSHNRHLLGMQWQGDVYTVY